MPFPRNIAFPPKRLRRFGGKAIFRTSRIKGWDLGDSARSPGHLNARSYGGTSHGTVLHILRGGRPRSGAAIFLEPFRVGFYFFLRKRAKTAPRAAGHLPIFDAGLFRRQLK